MLKRFAAIGLSAVLFAGTVTGCAYSDTAARVNGQETENNTEPTAYVETLEAKEAHCPHGIDDRDGAASMCSGFAHTWRACAEGRHAALEVCGQQVPDAGHEHSARHEALRVPHGLQGVLGGPHKKTSSRP